MPHPSPDEHVLQPDEVLARAVSAVFKHRPIIITAALKQFTAALAIRYPSLNIDVLSATLHVPGWSASHDRDNAVANEVAMGATHSTVPLFEVMIHSITGKASLLFTSGHFLTDAGGRRLNVDMREIEALLRALPGVMIAALQQALTDFWNEPLAGSTKRWQWLADLCKGALLMHLAPGTHDARLDAQQIHALQQVAHCPQKADRLQTYGADCADAFLVRYGTGQGETRRTRSAVAVLVTQTVNAREIVLQFAPSGAITPFDTLQAFADSGAFARAPLSVGLVDVQPWTITADAFVTLAQALLDTQLERVAQMGNFEGQDLAGLEAAYATISDTCALFISQEPDDGTPTLLHTVLEEQPDWLLLADADEVLAYSRYLLDLAALQQATDGKAYDEGIDGAATFARHALQRAMADFGPTFDPDNLLVTQTRYVADAPGASTGSAFVETDSLTRRAMKNLGGLLHAATTFRTRDGTPLPSWVTADTLRELISRTDIGKAYPALVRRELLDDQSRRVEREKRFADQLRIQLPMLALEYKISGKGSMTEAGYRQVAALMQPEPDARYADLQEIVFRPLAFVIDAADRRDVVGNMFVIGPQDTSRGPYVLYRPLYVPVFVECASWTILLGKIRDDKPITKSVLDWLERDARKVYDRGGFTEPHVPRVIFDVDFATLTAVAPPILSDRAVTGDVLTALYQANAEVLVRQADEQTVSDTEYRWATLLGLGGQVVDSFLGAAMPYLRGPVAATGWLLTMEFGVLGALRALDQGDTGPARNLLVNLVSQLAVALLVHRFPGGVSPQRSALLPAPENSATTRWMLPTGATTGLPDSVVDFSVAPSRHSSESLQRYLRHNPENLGPVIDAVPWPGIHVVNGRWYVRVPARIAGWGWASVAPAQAPNVVLLDRRGAPMKWLELRNKGQDLWDTAPEFRVRHGGGGASRLNDYVFTDPQLKAERAARQNRLQVLEEQRDALDKQVLNARDVGNAAFMEFQQAAIKLDEAREGVAQTQGAQQAQHKRDMTTAQQKLRITNQARLKAGESYVDLQLKYIALLDKVRPVLDADPDYLREARFHYLEEKLVRCNMTGTALESVSSTPPELGYTKENVFPLAYDTPNSPEGIPYNALLDARKRILKHYPTRIEVSQLEEATAAELAQLDEQVSQGRRSAQFINGVKSRPLNAEKLKIFEIISLRGALAGDALSEPSMVEMAGLEGLGQIPVGRVTWHLLELDATVGYTPNERILLLKDAIYHYNNALAFAHYLERPAGSTSYVPEEFVRKFISRVTEYRVMAEEALAKVARAQVLGGALEETVVSASKSRTRRNRGLTRRIIETSEGMVMGESSDELDEPDESVVATDPYTGKHTTYYRHEESDPIFSARRLESTTVTKPVPGLGKLLKDGRLLLDGVEGFKAWVSRTASAQLEPKSQEDTLIRQASKLDETANALNRRLQELSGTPRDNAADLSRRLSVAGQALRDEGVRLRIEGARRLPPTVGNLEYLLEKGEVRIGNWNWTDKSSVASGPDFLLEFEVLDEKSLARRQHKALWYAHFHCGEKNAGAMKKGHLKLAALRYKTYADQLREAQTRQVQAIESANITKSVATRLFFKRLPPGEQSI